FVVSYIISTCSGIARDHNEHLVPHRVDYRPRIDAIRRREKTIAEYRLQLGIQRGEAPILRGRITKWALRIQEDGYWCMPRVCDGPCFDLAQPIAQQVGKWIRWTMIDLMSWGLMANLVIVKQ